MDMDKVYIVQRTSGNWDSFHVWVDKVFIDQDKANVYVNKKNLQLDRLKTIAREFMLNYNDIDDCIDDYTQWIRYDTILEQGRFKLEEFNVTK
jgi:hypothetical protein